MNKWTFSGTLLLAISTASCQTGPIPTFYKAGTTFQERQFEYDQCKIEALREVPQALTNEMSGGYYNPGTLQCSTIGSYTSCNRVGAVNIPATMSTVDLNEGLRSRVMARCLASKGYDIIERPVCTDESSRMRSLYDPQPPSPAEIVCTSGVSLDS